MHRELHGGAAHTMGRWCGSKRSLELLGRGQRLLQDGLAQMVFVCYEREAVFYNVFRLRLMKEEEDAQKQITFRRSAVSYQKI